MLALKCDSGVARWSQLVNEFDVRSVLHVHMQVSLSAVNQICVIINFTI